MSAQLEVNVTGLALAHFRGVNPREVDILLPPADCQTVPAGLGLHKQRLTLPTSGIDWKNFIDAAFHPDLVVAGPGGVTLAIWELAPDTDIVLPGTGGMVDPDTSGKTSLEWLTPLSRIQLSGTTFSRNGTPVLTMQLRAGKLQATEFFPDPADSTNSLEFSFESASGVESPWPAQKLTTGLFWSLEKLPNDPQISINSGAKRIPLLNPGGGTIRGAISNTPVRPCFVDGGLLLEQERFYDYLTPEVANDRLVPAWGGGGSPPSLDSGFCPPGGFP